MQNISKKLRAGIVAVAVSSTLFGAALVGSQSAGVDFITRPDGTTPRPSKAVGVDFITRPGGAAVGVDFITRPGGD